MAQEGAPSSRHSRFYALSVTGGMEERVASLLAERARNMGLDVRSITVAPAMKGYIMVEVGDSADVYLLVRGLRHVKRKRPIPIQREEAFKLAMPVIEAPKLSRGQTVEIIGGPFKGMKGRIVEVYESRGEVDLTLIESDMRMVITIPADQVRPSEE